MTWQRNIEDLLADRIGLDPLSVGAGLITAAVRRRMRERGLDDPAAYLALLQADSAELDELVEQVVVPESWFFRDRKPFEFLKQHAAGWRLDPSRPPLRALSLACARGEEPYSIAMTLLDAGLPPARFQIDAADVSGHSLEYARRGIYSTLAFRGPDIAFRDRYFRPQANGFALDPSVRQKVRFVHANLLDLGPLAQEPPYDVVFCRNVIIYLNDRSRILAVAAFDRLLAQSGLLFVGHAEAMAILESRFAPVGEPGCFAFERAASGVPRPRSEPSPCLEAEAPAAPTPESPPCSTRHSVLSTVLSTRHSALGIEQAAPPESALLERAAALANQRQYDQAVRLCQRQLREGGPSAQAYFLLGTIHRAAGDDARAEACFEKVVYLDSQHDEALLALALFAQRRGDAELSARYRRRAERAAARKEAP
jgi:chemotaxis protein methyltransferase WspC